MNTTLLRKAIIVAVLLVALVSFASAVELDDDRTKYYNFGSGVYGADGINSTDQSINGTIGINGLELDDAGWAYRSGGGTIYSNSQKWGGSSVSILGNDDTIRTAQKVNNSFTGIVRMSVYCTGTTGLTWRIYNDSVHYKLRMEINGGSIAVAGYELDNFSWFSDTVGGQPLNTWFNVSIEMNRTAGGKGEVVYTINDTPIYNLTNYGILFVVAIAFDPSSNCYIDNIMTTNNGLLEEEAQAEYPSIDDPVNCTSCDIPNGDITEPYETEDTTPTFKFDTNENAWCVIGRNDEKYTTMNATNNGTCASGEGGTDHICTLPVKDRFEDVGQSYAYISCIDAEGNEDTAASKSLLMEIGGAGETDGDTAITIGITTSEIGGTATIYSNQQVSARNLAANQFLGTFDKVAVEGDKRYAFNYVSSGETAISGLFNITPVLYVLQLQNPTNITITDQVGKLINNTYP